MPPVVELAQNCFFSFLVILIRMTSFFFTAPVLSGTTVPAQAKIGLAAVVSAIVLMVGGPLTDAVPANVTEAVILVAGEVALGLTLGYAASLVFAGVQIGGMLIGYQIGFGVANVLDPVSNEQVSIVGQFLFLFAVIYFLAMDAHHILLKGLADSYLIAPAGSFTVTQAGVWAILEVFSRMFWLGMKIAMPVVGAIFLVDVALGIVAKTVPQMNVFIVGLPLKALLGMLILGLGFPLFGMVMRFDFDWMVRGFYGLMKLLQ